MNVDVDRAVKPVGITVVMPSYNQGQFIKAALRSLLDQQYPDLEILVLDGGSTDDTVEILRSFGHSITWTSGPDEGQSDAIATGFTRATRPWLTWLNSDDVQCGEALWRIASAVAAHPDVDVVFGHGHYMTENGSYLRAYPTMDPAAPGGMERQVYAKGYVAQPSVFFTRAAYERVGGIDRTLQYCMDYELWCKLACSGARFQRVDADLSGNRWHDAAKTASNTLDLLAEVAMVQRRYFGRVSPYFVQAISDHLYDRLIGSRFGTRNHILHRWLCFKSVWLWLNAGRPLFCIRGLLCATIAKSGPIEKDLLSWRDLRLAFRKRHA